MRKLMWFALGYAVASAACVYLLWGSRVWTLAVAMILFYGASAFFTRIREKLRRPMLVFLGMAAGLAGFGVYRQYYIMPATAYGGETIHAVITADTYTTESAFGSMVDGNLILEGKSYKIRTYLRAEDTVSPGDKLEGDFRIRLTAPGGQKESTYFQGKGIFLLGSLKGEVQITSPQKIPLRFYPQILAERVRKILAGCFDEDVFPFAQALLLGDSSDLDYATNTAFKISGIRHVIAVSGLHVAFLYGIIRSLTRKNRFLTALLGIPTLLLFAAVVGFTPSVTRAAIMVGLMMLSELLDRDYDAATELSFAGLVMLAVQPFLITSASFQMSMCSVAGILLFQQRIYHYLNSRKFAPKDGIAGSAWRFVTGSASMTLSALSLTLPLSTWYFGAVSLVAVITNILTLWCIGIIFCGVIIVCLLGHFWLPGGRAVAGTVGWLIRYVLTVARAAARIPYAAVYTKSIYIQMWLCLLYVFLALFLVSRKKRVLRCSAAVFVTLVLAIFASWAEPKLDAVRATILDVGQGQSILLQCDGQNFLVDCGGSSAVGSADMAAETLLSQGVFHLDGILLTHYDYDHVGGMENLLTRIRADRILLPGGEDDGLVSRLADVTDADLRPVVNNMQLPLGKGVLTFYMPDEGSTKNEKSVGVLFERENCAILVTGDRDRAAEKVLMRNAELPEVDLLIAGHHGSKYSTSDELLQTVRPRYVAISVGENNYGHPAQETLNRLRAYGCIVYRTDREGTIVYRR